MERERGCPYCFRVMLISAAALVFVLVMLQPSRFSIPEWPFELQYWVADEPLDISALPAGDDTGWQWLPPNTDSLGFSRSSVWLRMPLPDRPLNDSVLVFNSPFVDYIDIYVRRDGAPPELLAAVGDRRAFLDRPVSLPRFIIPLPFGLTAEDELLLYVANDGAIMFPLILAPTMDAVLGSYSAQLYFHGLMSGVFVFTALLAFAIGLLLRRSMELYFGGMILSILFVQAELNGVLYAFLWPNSPGLNLATYVGTMTAAICGASFTLQFLQGERPYRWYDQRILRTLRDLLVVLLVLFLVNTLLLPWPNQQWVKVSQIMTALVGLGMVLAGLRASLQGSERGQIFFAAIVLIIAGMLILVARSAGYVPDTLLTGAALELGSVLAVMILTGAVVREIYAEKNRMIRVQKDLLRKEADATELQAKLIRQALTNDSLKLPNRQSLLLFMEQEKPLHGTLLLIGFKHHQNIERTMGISVANNALVAITERLASWAETHTDDLAYGRADHERLDNGPFYSIEDAVLGILIRSDGLDEVLVALRKVLERGVSVGNFEVDLAPVFSSIACADFDLDEEDLVQAALSSLDLVTLSPDHLAYQPAHQQDSLDRLFLLSALSAAIDQSNLELYLQPLMNLQGDEIVAAEVLLRWHHKILGAVSPMVFVPLAEETGIITRLTVWLAQEVCRVHHQLQHAGIDIGLSINISAEDLAHPDVIARILDIAKTQAGDALRLKLELTETAVMRSGRAVRESVDLIKASGLGFSIDDFGAGHSSLSRIHELPVNELKIDRSILETSMARQEFSVLKSAIGLARSLRLRVVVEGVSTSEQLKLLRKLRVDAVQGYLIARPQPVEQFITWLKARNSTSPE